MRRFIVTPLALFTLSTLTAPGPALACEVAEPPTLSVSGEAVVTAAPDEAEIRLAVVTEGEDATETARQNARSTEEVIRSLVNAGAEREKIETVSFSVEPQYDYNARREGKPPRIIGYRVSNDIRLTTLNLDRTGAYIGAGIEAGANRVSGLTFNLRDNAPQRAEAIRIATRSARHDADTLADAAGIRLDGVHRIEIVSDGVRPMQRQFDGRAAAMESAAPPVNPGDIEVRVRVNMIYRVADRD